MKERKKKKQTNEQLRPVFSPSHFYISSRHAYFLSTCIINFGLFYVKLSVQGAYNSKYNLPSFERSFSLRLSKWLSGTHPEWKYKEKAF